MKLSNILSMILKDAEQVVALHILDPKTNAVATVVLGAAEVITQLVEDVKAELTAAKAPAAN
jgi:hypothetical protein